MKIQAIVAHPRTNSFCYALFERAISTIQSHGHDVIVHDLYAEGFDPVLKPAEGEPDGLLRLKLFQIIFFCYLLS